MARDGGHPSGRLGRSDLDRDAHRRRPTSGSTPIRSSGSSPPGSRPGHARRTRMERASRRLIAQVEDRRGPQHRWAGVPRYGPVTARLAAESRVLRRRAAQVGSVRHGSHATSHRSVRPPCDAMTADKRPPYDRMGFHRKADGSLRWGRRPSREELDRICDPNGFQRAMQTLGLMYYSDGSRRSLTGRRIPPSDD